MLSTHTEVREALHAAGIPYALCYPERGCLEEYLERYRQRGSSSEFCALITRNWDVWLEGLESDACAWKHVVLKPLQYAGDIDWARLDDGAFLRAAQPVLFLDVDGVLNRCVESGWGLQAEQCHYLQEILRLAQPRIVLSSSWRTNQDQTRRIQRLLRGMGAELYGVTPDSSCIHGGVIYTTGTRADEIRQWLAENSGPMSRFAILDDESHAGISMGGNFFQTQSTVGLTWEIASKVVEHLTGADRRECLVTPYDPRTPDTRVGALAESDDL